LLVVVHVLVVLFRVFRLLVTWSVLLSNSFCLFHRVTLEIFKISAVVALVVNDVVGLIVACWSSLLSLGLVFLLICSTLVVVAGADLFSLIMTL